MEQPSGFFARSLILAVCVVGGVALIAIGGDEIARHAAKRSAMNQEKLDKDQIKAAGEKLVRELYGDIDIPKFAQMRAGAIQELNRKTTEHPHKVISYIKSLIPSDMFGNPGQKIESEDERKHAEYDPKQDRDEEQDKDTK